jgi:hypothetical protein
MYRLCQKQQPLDHPPGIVVKAKVKVQSLKIGRAETLRQVAKSEFVLSRVL